MVASRQHKLEKQQLEVRLHEPPQMCKDRLVVGNLPEVKTADEVQNFVEAKTMLDVQTILFAEEEGTAVVIFNSDVGEFFVVVFVAFLS